MASVREIMVTMRIIGGQFRGRKIEQPDSGSVRPTKDRIRESLFDIIAEKVPGSVVLDLFAGSGAFGLEALSRGAERAVFIDKEPVSIKTIEKNIDILGQSGLSEIIQDDVLEEIEMLYNIGAKFDLIFCDPPYKKELAKKSLIILSQYDILKPSGLLVVEHHKEEELPESSMNITICKQKTYNNIAISVFQKK